MNVEGRASDTRAIEHIRPVDGVQVFLPHQFDERVAEPVARPADAAIGLSVVFGLIHGHRTPDCPVLARTIRDRAARLFLMTDERKGGIALITGTIAVLVTMALHPTGHELLDSGGRFNRVALLGVVAHTLAEVALPILFLGALALTRRLSSPDRSAIAALVLYGFALIAGMVAAAVSGYVAPALARQITAAT